jgi:hypothetical protein
MPHVLRSADVTTRSENQKEEDGDDFLEYTGQLTAALTGGAQYDRPRTRLGGQNWPLQGNGSLNYDTYVTFLQDERKDFLKSLFS